MFPAQPTAINPSAFKGRINESEIDTNIPGRVDVPSVKISVPLVWTKNITDFDADLKKGVVHYPGTPLPGGIGNSYISGHSSGYLFDKSVYKNAFAPIGNTSNGTKFSITYTLKTGKTAGFALRN